MSRPTRFRRRAEDARRPAPTEDELAAPSWQVPAAAHAGLWRLLRSLPATVRQILALTWAAGPAATLTVIVLQLLAGTLGALGLLTVGDALSRLLGGELSADRLARALPVLAAATAIYGAKNLMEFAVQLTQVRLKPAVKRLADDRLYEATVHVELAAYDDPGFHDAMTRARDQARAHIEDGADRLADIASAVIGIIGAAAVVGVLHPVLVPMLVLAALPAGYATIRGARIAHHSVQRRTTLYRRLWIMTRLLADRGPAAEVRTYTAQGPLLAERHRLASSYEAEEVRVGRARVRGLYAGETLSRVAVGAALILLGWLCYTGITPLAVAGTAAIAIRLGQSALVRLTLACAQLFEQGLYVQEYTSFVRLAQARRRPRTGRSVCRDFREIRLDRVTFAYPGRDAPAVRDVTLTVARGEVVALVGENGSGKSTLARLIAGLYLPGSGTVHWGDTNLAEVDERSVHENVAFVMQTPTQWPMTARENITIGRPERADPDDRLLRRAAAASGADSIVARLPKGYGTLLSKEFRDGHDLSGGEWQRMAAARAFYRDAAVLICDEPSAAMDAFAEQELFKRIYELAAGRTVLLITHRLSAARNVDKIFVLHRGNLIESGTHTSLMAAGGRYSRLYTLQAQGYAELPGPRAAVGGEVP